MRILNRVLYPIKGIDIDFNHDCGAKFAVEREDGSKLCLGCNAIVVKEDASAETVAE